MGFIFSVFQTQWIYILISILLTSSIFIVKKYYKCFLDTFCKIGLITTTVVMLILSIFFNQPDLFLLIPIFIFCCELINYEISCKVASMLAVNYILIVLINFLYEINIINLIVNNILFYGLQVLVIVGLAKTVDNYMKKIKKNKESQEQLECIENKDIQEKTEFIKYNNKEEHKELNDELSTHIKEVLKNISKDKEFSKKNIQTEDISNMEDNTTNDFQNS